MEYATSVHCFNGVMFRFILLYGLLDVITVTVLLLLLVLMVITTSGVHTHTHTRVHFVIGCNDVT